MYSPPALNTTTAPRRVPGANLFPKSHMLSSKLMSLRMLRTMVTVSAVETAASKFTPRMQAYWVSTLVTRNISWLGACANRYPTPGISVCKSIVLLAIILLYELYIADAKGTKRGRERAWE